MRVLVYLENHLCLLTPYRFIDLGNGDVLLSVSDFSWNIIVHNVSNMPAVIEKLTVSGYISLINCPCEYLRESPEYSEQPDSYYEDDDLLDGSREINLEEYSDFNFGL